MSKRPAHTPPPHTLQHHRFAMFRGTWPYILYSSFYFVVWHLRYFLFFWVFWPRAEDAHITPTSPTEHYAPPEAFSNLRTPEQRPSGSGLSYGRPGIAVWHRGGAPPLRTPPPEKTHTKKHQHKKTKHTIFGVSGEVSGAPNCDSRVSVGCQETSQRIQQQCPRCTCLCVVVVRG